MKHPIQPLHVNKIDVLTTLDFILRTMTKNKEQRFKKWKKKLTKQNYQGTHWSDERAKTTQNNLKRPKTIHKHLKWA